MRYLKKQFQPHILSRKNSSWTTTFKIIWKYKKRLIILYDHHTYKQILKIWPPIPQMWGNVQSIDKLRSYLDLVENNRYGRP